MGARQLRGGSRTACHRRARVPYSTRECQRRGIRHGDLRRMTATAAAAQLSVSVSVQIGSTALTNTELGHVELREELGDHTYCSISFSRDRATDLRAESLVT